ncbi:tRNA lysidine(34) synthetase TilS [Halarcobacter anaerophilus]|uniref:tRNA(Ile)-lysidine synthase n=1 Tax=Halarcobacter anaerophilus TaxID=877500 RepID=A0A4V1LQ19_9BACT|nr:tRNA lysidine(34) synthetase TilS [Halarcobacter anaerophilus]QDF30114.1 tRNA(Ile)-lysidine synthetase [Halarcobacter anaerophilus]RXJ63158.1 tRNA lysidine(34) synthetase TilS [Halarcobacter anaerophilus]
MKLQINTINTSRNLLAFSGGVDSSALFFILLENNIPFDLAIVNYNVREQSKQEVEYAKFLAKKYNKKIYLKDVKFEDNSNFEKKARDSRYSFFEKIIEENSYETLITAHQLNDKLEWFFMQLSRGAGLIELISFEEITKKETYRIYRPLLNITKEELKTYLKENSIKYFVDETNFDERYRRNYFRKNFSDNFLKEFKEGVKRSFEYLKEDINSLNIEEKALLKEKELEVFKNLNDDNLNIRNIDLSLKKRGILLTKAQRDEILKQKELVISHKISINITTKYIFISPYEKEIMPKDFKEKCRVNKIPKNIRAYIFKEKINKIFDLMF